MMIMMLLKFYNLYMLKKAMMTTKSDYFKYGRGRILTFFPGWNFVFRCLNNN